MGNFLFQNKFHQFLGRRRHILEALSERHDREAHALKVLYHLYGSPAVKGDLSDVEPLSELLDELFNVSVVDDVALRGHKDAPPFPQIVRNMVAPHTKIKSFFRYPEVRKNTKPVLLILRREHENERRDVRSA